jgi:hypothetical protein
MLFPSTTRVSPAWHHEAVWTPPRRRAQFAPRSCDVYSARVDRPGVMTSIIIQFASVGWNRSDM